MADGMSEFFTAPKKADGSEPSPPGARRSVCLQAGLGLPSRPKSGAYSHGETVKVVVRVRNVGKEEVKFQYLRQFFIETPTRRDGWRGQARPPRRIPDRFLGLTSRLQVNLAPGKEIELYELKLRPKPASEVGVSTSQKEGPEALVREALGRRGRSAFSTSGFFGMSSGRQVELDPNLSKLATGKLELEINPETSAATERK